jgi:hypothetical protein
VRFAAIRGLGYTYGSNRAWLMRTVGEAFGPFGGPIMTHHWLGPAIAFWLFGLGCLGAYGWRYNGRLGRGDVVARRFRLVLLLALVAVAGVGALGALYFTTLAPHLGTTSEGNLWAAGLIVAADGTAFRYAIAGVFGLSAFVTLVRHRPWVLLLATAWTYAFLLPLVVSPGPSHRYYLSQGGYALAYSLAAGLWAAALLDALPERLRARALWLSRLLQAPAGTNRTE